MSEINEDYSPKPPIGVMPKWRWDELYPNPTIIDIWCRLNTLNDAIKRYEAANHPIPDEWYRELAGA